MPHSILNELMNKKAEAVQTLLDDITAQAEHPLRVILESSSTFTDRAFSSSLTIPHEIAFIAEVKRRSPSAGVFFTKPEIKPLIASYEGGGAKAISILTDEPGFGGHLNDLLEASKLTQIPLLRKDFILYPIQLAEAKLAGASAVLLIASLFQKNSKDLENLIQKSHQIGLECLVEVHTDHDLHIACDSGAEIIGVNQRNLDDFSMNPHVYETLSSKIPTGMIRVAESGIKTREDALRAKNLGYHAVLVGEILVRSHRPEQLLLELQGKTR